MFSKGSAEEGQDHSKEDIQQLRNDFQLVVEHWQVSTMHALIGMMSKFMRNTGRSQSSSAGSGAAGREGPRGAEPSAVVRETFAAAGGVAGDTATGRETTLREDASRNLRATGRRYAAVPFEVGSAKGQPDQPWRASKCDASPGGEVGGGFDLPISRHFSYKPSAAAGNIPTRAKPTHVKETDAAVGS